MNKSRLKTWASKEKELKARLESLNAARQEGIKDDRMESGVRFLIEELITMRGQVEKDIENEELVDLEKELLKGVSREVA